MIKNREHKIIRAAWVGVVLNSVLALLKIVFGVVVSSYALIADGIDSTADVVSMIIVLFSAKLMKRPPNVKYAYGYEKAETVATKILSIIIIFAGIQFLVLSIGKLVQKTAVYTPDYRVILIVILSIFTKLYLSIYFSKKSKKLQSSMLSATSKNMMNDMFVSALVLVGLGLTHILNVPVLDKVIAILIAVWIIKVGLNIFKQNNIEIMDGIQNPEIYNILFDAIDEINGVYNPHKARIRKVGYMYLISLDIEVDGSKTIDEAHELSKQVEDNIHQHIRNVYDILIHIEPFGNKEEEPFGVSKDEL